MAKQSMDRRRIKLFKSAVRALKKERECLKRISIPHYIKKNLKTCPRIFVHTVDFWLGICYNGINKMGGV